MINNEAKISKSECKPTASIIGVIVRSVIGKTSLLSLNYKLIHRLIHFFNIKNFINVRWIFFVKNEKYNLG
jgi:hypothetical protein